MRNYNIDREPVSSEEVSTFKDFKSILRKHAQTTEDLAKIKPVASSSKMYWLIGGAISALTFGALVIFSGDSNDFIVEQKTIEQKQVPLVEKTVALPKIKWQTVIRTAQVSVESRIGVNTISADRVNFAEFSTSDEVTTLIKSIQKPDADFVKASLVFKLDKGAELELSNANDLFTLSEKGQWEKVEYKAIAMPQIQKPELWKKGEPAINIEFGEFDGPASKYKNVVWKALNPKDLDVASDYYTTNWEDVSIEKTAVGGLYTITLKTSIKVKQFSVYPALYGQAYENAMADYNKNLMKAQEELKVAPKHYSISEGVYTVK